MKVDVYNQEGEKVGTTLLPKEIFDVSVNPDLVHQVAVSQMANQRRVIAHTKDRGEVRGGGRKPWRQKGTGRARHGSRRSPLWRGGGVTFGPTKDRVFKKKVNKKIKRKALFMVLSAKVKNNLLILLDKIRLEKSKTKEISEILKKLPGKEKSSLITELPKEAKVKKRAKKSFSSFVSSSTRRTKSFLIVLPGMDKNIILAVRNIPGVKVVQAKDLNVLNLLSFKYLIMSKEAIKVAKETFLK